MFFMVILAVKVVKKAVFGGFGGQNGGQRPPIGPIQILRVEEVIRVPCAKFQLPSTFLARGAPCIRFMLKICQSAPPFSKKGLHCLSCLKFFSCLVAEAQLARRACALSSRTFII